jgi:hypothetical protein
MSDYQLLVGTTFENAIKGGAMYIYRSPSIHKMFSLPAQTVERLGYVPPVEIAWMLHERMEFQKGSR